MVAKIQVIKALRRRVRIFRAEVSNNQITDSSKQGYDNGKLFNHRYHPRALPHIVFVPKMITVNLFVCFIIHTN